MKKNSEKPVNDTIPKEKRIIESQLKGYEGILYGFAK